MHRAVPLRTLVLLPALLVLACTEDAQIAGNSTSTGNAQASGLIVQPSGRPASGVWIECSPDSLAPWNARRPGWTTLTDSNGRYECTELPSGRVGIAAYDPATGLTRWQEDTVAPSVRTDSRPDTLAAAGSLRVALPPGLIGVLYFSGLTRSIAVHDQTELEIPELPAGWRGRVLFASSLDRSSVVDSGLRIGPGGLDSAGYTRRTATLRVPLAGKLTTALTQVPLLVRLDSTWDGFAASLPDGSDLRLATPGGRALPLSIVSWNRGARTGVFWTSLDTLPAPGDSVDLRLSWGLAVPATKPAAAFQTSGGWLSVWPLGDTGSSVQDRLGRFPGSPTALAPISGVVGNASRFDGSSSKVVIPGSATGLLALPDSGPYTMSCWARLRSYTSSRYVMGHGSLGSSLKFQASLSGYTNSWMAIDFHTNPSGEQYTLAPADTGAWTHLAMTVDGDSVRLFVNGTLGNLAKGFNHSTSPRTAVNFAIGAALDSTGTADRLFSGDLAEVWVHGLVRAPDWIRIVAANEAPGAPRARSLP